MAEENAKTNENTNVNEGGAEKSEVYRTQEEFDKAFSTKLEKVRSKLQEELKAESEASIKKAVADAQAEAQRQAKLSEDERRKEEDSKRLQEINDLKNQNALLQNSAKATKTLEERGIPISLLDYVVDVDEDKMSKNIDTFETAFNKAVQSAVDDKLKGTTPKSKDPENKSTTPKYDGPVAI